MATWARFQVVLPMDSANFADAVVNRFHFRKDTAVTDAVFGADVRSSLVAFYGDLSTLLSPLIDNTLVRIKGYDLEEDEPRQPFFDETVAITAPTAGASLPSECCMVGSFRGTFVSGVNPLRRRNRVFLGPLKQSTIEDAGNSTKFTLTARNAANTALDNLLASSAADPDFTWGVWSQRHFDTGALASQAFDPVVAGHVDNAVDIQRRRGVNSTARSTFS